MSALLQIAVINAVTVLPLAVMALVVGRATRRPALTHALWVLVLLKFVTPPLFNLPVTIEVPVAESSRGVEHIANVDVPLPPASLGNESANLADRVARPESSKGVAESYAAESHALRKDSGRATQAASPINLDDSSLIALTLKACFSLWSRRPDLRWLLLTAWWSGTAVWMTLQIVRAMRFQRRVVHGAIPNLELQRQTQQLAEPLGLRTVPRVLIVDATVSPMLWGCGSRTKLLFPSDLFERLDDNARATLVTHELAHFARGDHWVRLLELIVTGLFWWHPVVWWAKQQIEQSEEVCCDAWVVGQFPHAPRQYAEALLDTIDFLCESRQSLPPVACGLGQPNFLRRRLTQIMRGASPKAMSQRVRCAVALVAALLLPLQPFVFGSASISSLLPVAVSPSESAVVLEGSEVRGRGSETTASEFPPDSNSASQPVSSPTTSRRIRGEQTWSTAASADGRFVVRATTARRVLTDRSTNQETDLSPHGITAVAFVPDRTSFVAAGSDGRVTLWNAAKGEPTRVLHIHASALRSVSVSPRGDAVAVGGKDGSVLVLDLASSEPPVELPRQAMAVNCVRFSPDARSLAVAIGDWDSNARGQVVLFDVETKVAGAVLECESAPGAVTFASNGDVIVGLWNGQADLWNLESHRLVGSAQANKSVVAAASFSPDNPALREVDFVATRPVAVEDKSDTSLLDFLFGGRQP